MKQEVGTASGDASGKTPKEVNQLTFKMSEDMCLYLFVQRDAQSHVVRTIAYDNDDDAWLKCETCKWLEERDKTGDTFNVSEIVW